jgi:hypothetical protein
METFKKRQREMKRLERQQEKAAKRKEHKELKARGGIVEPADADTERPLDSVSVSDEGEAAVQN